MSTKIFCDIADIKLIRKFTNKNIVKGFTTNPSLIRKAGAKNYLNYCKKISFLNKMNEIINYKLHNLKRIRSVKKWDNFIQKFIWIDKHNLCVREFRVPINQHFNIILITRIN